MNGDLHQGDKEGFPILALVVGWYDFEVVAELRVAVAAVELELLVVIQNLHVEVAHLFCYRLPASRYKGIQSTIKVIVFFKYTNH